MYTMIGKIIVGILTLFGMLCSAILCLLSGVFILLFISSDLALLLNGQIVSVILIVLIFLGAAIFFGYSTVVLAKFGTSIPEKRK